MNKTAKSVSTVPDGHEIINRVFIGGLARDTSELELENFFSTFGEVTDVRIVCDRKTGFNKGYGFVTFNTTKARDDLIEKGTIDYKGGRKLRLRKAVKKETGGQFFSTGSSNQIGTQPQQLVLVPVEPNMNMNMPPLINCNAVYNHPVQQPINYVAPQYTVPSTTQYTVPAFYYYCY